MRAARQRAGIPAAPAPDPDSEVVTIEQAAGELSVSTFTVRRWLRDGLLPGEQATAGAPWRIRLSAEVRAHFVPEVPDGFVPLAEAARLLGCARQTVLQKVQRGELRAIHVTKRSPQGASNRGSGAEPGPIGQRVNEEVQCETGTVGPGMNCASRTS